MSPTCVAHATRRAIRPLLVGIALVASLLMAVAPTEAAARTFHLAVDGSDANAGDQSAPWRTLTHAMRQLSSGDTLVVHGGTYVERVMNPTLRPGTPEAPVTVRAAAGERPVVKGLFWVRNADHWRFDGINVTWDPATGAYNEHMVKITNGIGWEFVNAEVWGARSFAAMLIAGTVTGQPADWRVADNCIHDTAATNGTNQDHNIYANTGMSPGSGVIEGNLLFGAPNGENLKLGGPSSTSGGAANVTVRRNTMVGAAQNVLVAWGAHDITFTGNLLGESASNYGNLRGYRLEGSGVTASGNLGYAAKSLILNDSGYTGIADLGDNVFPIDPLFDGRTCSSFRPLNPLATGYGHWADATTQDPEPVATETASEPEPESTETSSEPEPEATETSSEPEPVATEASSEPEPEATETSSEPQPESTETSSEPEPVATETSSEPQPEATETTTSKGKPSKDETGGGGKGGGGKPSPKGS